jgi:hypothetical protein
MPAKWTPARRIAHSKRIRELRADPNGAYADAPRKLSEAHRAGKHPGFGQRTCMTGEQRREAGRLATMRYRARKAGKRVTRNMFPARPSWPSVADACARLDALSPRGARPVTHQQIVQGHLWEWYTVGTAADSVTETDVNDALRMAAASYRPERRGGVVPSWSDVRAQRHSAELQRLVAEQRADAAA